MSGLKYLTIVLAMVGIVSTGARGQDKSEELPWKVVADPAKEKAVEGKPFRLPVAILGVTVHGVLPGTPGHFLAIPTADAQKIVWNVIDLSTSKLVAAKPFVGEERPDVVGAVIDPTGTMLAAPAGPGGGGVVVWSMKEGKILYRLKVDVYTKAAVAFLENDRLLCTAGTSFEVVDLKQNRVERTIKVEKSDMTLTAYYAVSPGGRYVATAAKGGVVVYDLKDGSVAGNAMPPGEKNGHGFSLTCKGIAFSRDGSELAAIFDDQANGKGTHVISWEISSGKVKLDVTKVPTQLPMIDVADRHRWIEYFDDGAHIHCHGAVLDRTTGAVVATVPMPASGFLDRTFLLASGKDQMVTVTGSGKTTAIESKAMKFNPAPAK